MLGCDGPSSSTVWPWICPVPSQGPSGTQGWPSKSQGRFTSEVESYQGALGTVPLCLGEGTVVLGPPVQDVNQEGGLGHREFMKCKQHRVGNSTLLLLEGLPLRVRLQQGPTQPRLRPKRS